MKTTSHIPTEAWDTTTIHQRSSSSILSHTSFYWGHRAQILFSGWPGRNPGMYALALIFVFSLAVLVECLIHSSLLKPGAAADKLAAGFFKTGVYAVRSGLNYMVILAVASFNGGVFLAAIFGHAFGYLIFGSRVCKKTDGGRGENDK